MTNSEVLIKVENVSKKFCRRLKRSLWYGMKDLGSELIGRSSSHKDLRKDEFWANKDISFELKRGDTLGLIGCNGSGKTTLLRMLNGLIKPDAGRIEVRGRMQALIALGAGFNPILTGRENIYVNAAVLGIPKDKVDRQFDEIVDFSGIGEFIDTPVRSYSSGMTVRLGFAVAAYMEPDILLLDEILAVGDISFQSKCFQRITELKKNGVATILVSHHMPKIGSFCNRVLYLSSGEKKLIDKSHVVINAYEYDMSVSNEMDYIPWNESCVGYTPLGGAKIENVRFEQKYDGEVRIRYGEPIRFSFDYDLSNKDINDCVFAILAKRVVDGVMCFGALSNFHGIKITERKGSVKISVEEHNLVPNLYNIDIQIRTKSYDIAYAAHREPRVIVKYPEDKYILQNLAGIYQPNKIIWKI